jgi:hypothetical protein
VPRKIWQPWFFINLEQFRFSVYPFHRCPFLRSTYICIPQRSAMNISVKSEVYISIISYYVRIEVLDLAAVLLKWKRRIFFNIFFYFISFLILVHLQRSHTWDFKSTNIKECRSREI